MVKRMASLRRTTPEKAELNQRNYQRREQELRQRALELLGNKCTVCGFSDPRALQIDHIAGGGYRAKLHMSVLRRYKNILKVKGEGYQLLCANCNQIKKYVNKENPHRSGTKAMTPISGEAQQLKLLMRG